MQEAGGPAPSARRPDGRSGNRWLAGLTARNILLVIGVLAIQLAFIASYLGAFHNPKPHRVPVAVAAPPGAPPEQARQVADQLDAIAGAPLSARVVPDEATARREIAHREIYGAYLPGAQGTDRLLVDSAASASVSQALAEVFGQVSTVTHRPLRVDDIIPAGTGDARGLSAFYLAVGWMLGGYLVATGLSVSTSARPRHHPAAVLRLGALAFYSVASGIAGALITVAILGTFRAHAVGLWLLGTLLVYGSGAFAMGLQSWTGVIGVGLTVVVLVVLGNPSAGGAYASPLLPPFWRTIGQWLPPGAGTTAIRGILYFHGNGLGVPLLILWAYAIAGSAATLAAVALANRRGRAAEGAGASTRS